MASDQPIIIKKVKKGGGHGHHGGAWKVAYADFVTAMMAFFLMMWLINNTEPEQREGIADYFAPILALAASLAALHLVKVRVDLAPTLSSINWLPSLQKQSHQRTTVLRIQTPHLSRRSLSMRLPVRWRVVSPLTLPVLSSLCVRR